MKSRIDLVVALLAVIVAAWLAVALFVPVPGAPSPSGAVAAAAPGGVKQDWLEGDAAQRERFKDLEGKPAPPLQVDQWTNGDAVTLEALRGKVVLLDFWGTWCAPCLAAVPHVNQLQAKHRDRGFVAIGVCDPEGADTMAKTVKEKNFQYLVARDPQSKTAEAYKIEAMPTYHLIDRAGNLRVLNAKQEKLDEAIAALLAEAPAK
ncbi:MAG TPA: TlpA disulfide reductase family protein [Tepidisphaeraceae bacterium]|nr:TlpA disulfide reductase family protein [Tepidisphaeraceae bacterium]